MARTIDEAFNQYLSWLSPSDTETSAAKIHRESIDDCILREFGRTHFFRSGSFGFGTSVSGFSDVDYFSVIPGDRLKKNSRTSLYEIADKLRARFPKTGVYVDDPAIVIPFGTGKWERHEVVPAHLISNARNFRLFGIPDRHEGWMYASPESHSYFIDKQNERLSYRVKPLIRLIKAWKYQNNISISSFYLEMAVAAWAQTQNSVVFWCDMHLVLSYLANNQLSDLLDPMGMGVTITAGSAIDRARALTGVVTGANLANEAYQANNSGNTTRAFTYFGTLFNGSFPKYY